MRRKHEEIEKIRGRQGDIVVITDASGAMDVTASSLMPRCHTSCPEGVRAYSICSSDHARRSSDGDIEAISVVATHGLTADGAYSHVGCHTDWKAVDFAQKSVRDKA